MLNVNLTTPAPQWPWRRQTKNNSGDWGPFRFTIDQPSERCDAWVVFEAVPATLTTLCPPDRLIFITGEPPDIGTYHPGFLAQFDLVVTCHDGLDHPNVLRLQQAHPWFVEQSYDDLLAMAPMAKTADVCVIVSDKAFTPGHRKRLEFVEALKQRLGDRLDVFGRGIRDFESKWSLLSQYRYCVVLENCEHPDFLTEKLPDAWLAFCFPFYSGCTNLDRYFAPGAHETLRMDDFDASIDTIVRCIDDPTHYARHLPKLSEARDAYLRDQQFFPTIAALVQMAVGYSTAPARQVTLRPNAAFGGSRQALGLGGLLRRGFAKIRHR